MSTNTLPRLDLPARGKSCAKVTTPKGTYYFSYRTIIAFEGMVEMVDSPDQYRKVRLANHWSRTTGRHFSDLGCKNFNEVSPETFAAIIGYAGNPDDLTKRV